jgi:putative transposase
VRRALIGPDPAVSIRRQCELLELPRSTYYYLPVSETVENLELLRLLDEQYLRTPFYGSRRMAAWLVREGYEVNRKRVQRLMRILGVEGLAPRPKTTKPAPGHRVFPYLLRNVEITHADQVWSTDITYIPLRNGYLYLAAILDWHSRYVLSWQLSNSLENSFCLKALDEALAQGKPEIFNTDQGVQFTSVEFTNRLLDRAVAISMDGRGRALDNAFIERLWRTVKYEEVYLKDYATADEVYQGLTNYFLFYNHERPHQALNYQTPYQLYHWGPETSSRRRVGEKRRVKVG